MHIVTRLQKYTFRTNTYNNGGESYECNHLFKRCWYCWALPVCPRCRVAKLFHLWLCQKQANGCRTRRRLLAGPSAMAAVSGSRPTPAGGALCLSRVPDRLHGQVSRCVVREAGAGVVFAIEFHFMVSPFCLRTWRSWYLYQWEYSCLICPLHYADNTKKVRNIRV